MATYQWTVTQLQQQVTTLKVSDRILLSGEVYTARDAAHKRLMGLLDEGKPLPFDLKGALIYYAGPTPSPKGLPIGSCGPTTSGRMDVFTPRLLDLGLGGMIGKGERSAAVVQSVADNNAVYLCALGGAGALACKAITACEVIAFEDLGCESIKRLTLKDFPVTVAIDANGEDIFKLGPQSYLDQTQ